MPCGARGLKTAMWASQRRPMPVSKALLTICLGQPRLKLPQQQAGIALQRWFVHLPAAPSAAQPLGAGGAIHRGPPAPAAEGQQAGMVAGPPAAARAIAAWVIAQPLAQRPAVLRSQPPLASRRSRAVGAAAPRAAAPAAAVRSRPSSAVATFHLATKAPGVGRCRSNLQGRDGLASRQQHR